MRSAAPDAAPLIALPDPALVARFRAGIAPALSRLPAGARIGIAVSGGPDSLGMLLLAAAFLDRMEAATVDHGLRAESAGEATMVAEVCARLRVPHATLRGDWDSGAREGLQAAARTHRYRLLSGWCQRRGLALLATAHHADDQAETLLMRLARGAGLGGLGAIRHERPLDGGGVRLVRPLLGFTKAELVALVRAAGLQAVDDPSNDGDRFDRTHARRLLAQADWLDPHRIAAAAAHLAEADDALCWAAAREYAARVHRDGPGWLLDPAGLPDEILRRIVLLLWRRIEDEPDRPDPSGPALLRFIARLRGGESAMLGRVLARPGTQWRFAIAPPRRN